MDPNGDDTDNSDYADSSFYSFNTTDGDLISEGEDTTVDRKNKALTETKKAPKNDENLTRSPDTINGDDTDTIPALAS